MPLFWLRPSVFLCQHYDQIKEIRSHLFFVSDRCWVSGQAAQPVPLASLKLSIAVHGQKLDGRPSGRTTKTAHSAVLRKGR